MAAISGYKLPRTGRNVEDLLAKIDALQNATSELDGLMSKEDKAKLDEIEKTTIPVEIPTIDAGDDNPTTIATVGSSPIRVKVNRDNTKVDKEEGKQLSTNDFTNAYKAALDKASESEVIGFVCQSQSIKFYKPKEDGSFEARVAYEFDATDLIVSHNHNVVLYNISDSTFYAPIAYGVQGASGTEYWFFRISVSLEVRYILLYHQGNRPITRANIAGGRELATINSPEFVGTPKAPTMSKSDNSARIATTAFVKNVLSDYYVKPDTGIPATDLESGVRAILDDAVLHSNDVIYNADPSCNTAEIVNGIQMYTSGVRRKIVPDGYMAELTGGNYTYYILQYDEGQGGQAATQTILAYGASPVTWLNNTGHDVTVKFAASVSAPTNAKVYKIGYDDTIADIYSKVGRLRWLDFTVQDIVNGIMSESTRQKIKALRSVYLQGDILVMQQSTTNTTCVIPTITTNTSSEFKMSFFFDGSLVQVKGAALSNLWYGTTIISIPSLKKSIQDLEPWVFTPFVEMGLDVEEVDEHVAVGGRLYLYANGEKIDFSAYSNGIIRWVVDYIDEISPYTKTSRMYAFNVGTDEWTVTEGDYVTTNYVENKIQELPTPMQFKGSLGVGGTYTSETLPAASSSNIGWTLKVITNGTYQGITAKVGDSMISDGNAWVLIPSGDEPSGTVTSVGISMPTGFSVSGSPVTSGGTLSVSMASGYAIPTNTQMNSWNSKTSDRALTSEEISAIWNNVFGS